MDINDVLNNRDINFKQVDIAICPMCGNTMQVWAKTLPGNALNHASVIYVAKCKCGFKAQNLKQWQLLKEIEKEREMGPHYKIIESYTRMTKTFQWEEIRTVVDTANTFDEAMQKIKEYKTACGEDRILSVELISKDLQE